MIRFDRFYKIGTDLFYEMPTVHDSFLFRQICKMFPSASTKVKILLVLVQCYQKIFTDNPIVSDCINEHLLDFESINTHDATKLIFLKNTKGESFCFTLEELFQIFHNDLSKSVLDYEPYYKLFTITKTFRLPRHPYSGQTFSLDEILQILNNMVLSQDRLPALEYVEIYLFLAHARSLYSSCQGKSNYEMTTILDDFYQSKGLSYIQKYNAKAKENLSRWSSHKKIMTKNQKRHYMWFIENIYLEFLDGE